MKFATSIMHDEAVDREQTIADANVVGAPALIEIIPRGTVLSAARSPLSKARDGKCFIIIIIYTSIRARCTRAFSRARVTGEYVTCAYPDSGRGGVYALM